MSSLKPSSTSKKQFFKTHNQLNYQILILAKYNIWITKFEDYFLSVWEWLDNLSFTLFHDYGIFMYNYLYMIYKGGGGADGHSYFETFFRQRKIETY